jgi:hypothetical protein
MSAQCNDLLVIGRFSIAAYQEVKLKLVPINVPHDVHEPSFYTSAGHASNDVQDFSAHEYENVF